MPALLLVLALLAPMPATAQEAAGVPRGLAMVRSSLLAWRLAKEVKGVKKRFVKGRAQLEDQLEKDKDSPGTPVDPRDKVLNLISVTEDDFDHAFDKVDKRDELDPLRDWVHEELRMAREEAAAAPSTMSALVRPRPVAVVAALDLFASAGGSGVPTLEAGSSAGGSLETALDNVLNTILQVWTLSMWDDLVIDLNVFSVPDSLEFGLRELEAEKVHGPVTTNNWLRHVRRGEYYCMVEDSDYGRIDLVENFVKSKGAICCRQARKSCIPLAKGQLCDGH